MLFKAPSDLGGFNNLGGRTKRGGGALPCYIITSYIYLNVGTFIHIKLPIIHICMYNLTAWLLQWVGCFCIRVYMFLKITHDKKKFLA